MATIGHIAVGMAAARYAGEGKVPRWQSLASWSALSLVPDADVIGFTLGVEYGAPWGHRGATHSLAFSIALGLAIGWAAGRVTSRPWRTALLASAVLASHGLLDTITYGGLGCALLWPFTLARYSAPWQPVAAAPIGFGLLSTRGFMVALTETVLFAPVLVFALSRREHRTRSVGGDAAPGRLATRRQHKALISLLALWLAAAWLIASGDPLRDAILGFVLREDTAYAPDFSEAAFRRIGVGLPAGDARRMLGEPYGEDWRYPPLDQPGCRAIRFEAGAVVTALDANACKSSGIEQGMSPEQVSQRIGRAPSSCWQYSWSPSGGYHRQRVVCVENDKVAVVSRAWR
jgi:inner membrane protein